MSTQDYVSPAEFIMRDRVRSRIESWPKECKHGVSWKQPCKQCKQEQPQPVPLAKAAADMAKAANELHAGLMRAANKELP